MDKHLGVGVGREDVAERDQLVLERLVVVDLAVEHDDERAVLVVDGLGTVLEADDRQAAEAEGDIFVDVLTIAVGAAVDDAVHHRRKSQFGLRHRPGESYIPAHTSTPYWLRPRFWGLF